MSRVQVHLAPGSPVVALVAVELGEHRGIGHPVQGVVGGPQLAGQGLVTELGRLLGIAQTAVHLARGRDIQGLDIFTSMAEIDLLN